jgi:radical S-adenosyl methionine domain-containing protein 2
MDPVKPVSSVNYHVWQACNMRCRFCFATFQDVRRTVLPAGYLKKSDAIAVVGELARAGFEKINFAGGEPFLCPWLGKLIWEARNQGMRTSVVTNGSYFDRAVVEEMLPNLDWFVLSVDSVVPGTLRRLGRVRAHQPIPRARYLQICRNVRESRAKLKINTVVTSANCDERLDDFIREARPVRWKIMQVLPIDGPDSRVDEDLLITERQFDEFIWRNRGVWSAGVTVVPEANDAMIGSYVMVDPAGRFYDNVNGSYRYSRPILEVGAVEALKDVTVSSDAFQSRGGDYHASPTKAFPLRVVDAGMARLIVRKPREKPQ